MYETAGSGGCTIRLAPGRTHQPDTSGIMHIERHRCLRSLHSCGLCIGLPAESWAQGVCSTRSRCSCTKSMKPAVEMPQQPLRLSSVSSVRVPKFEPRSFLQQLASSVCRLLAKGPSCAVPALRTRTIRRFSPETVFEAILG